MNKKITDKQKEYAWNMYESGNSINYIAEYIKVSYTSAWVMTEGRKNGFKNNSDYQKYLAQKNGHNSLNNYKEHLAQEKGFESLNNYQKHLAQKRSKRYPNKDLSNLIKSSLKLLDKTQSWLAKEIGISKQLISLYANGLIIPKSETLEKLFNILKVETKPKSLEDLIEK